MYPKSLKARYIWTSSSLAALISICLPFLAPAQTISSPRDSRLIPFHVKQNGRQVEGLTADDILLTENREPQKVTYFWSAEAQPESSAAPPIHLAILVDTSNRPSTGTRAILPIMPLHTKIVLPFPSARVSVYGYSTELMRYCGPTGDATTLAAALQTPLVISAGMPIKPVRVPLDAPLERPKRGGTLEWDTALIQTAWDAARQTPRGTVTLVVAFFAGLPGEFDHPDAVIRAYRAAHAALYFSARWQFWVRQYVESNGMTGKNEPEPEGGGLHWSRLNPGQKLEWATREWQMIHQYEQAAESTGGWSFDGNVEASGVVDELAWELGGLYVAGYQPPPSPDAPGPRRVEIRLADPTKGTVASGTAVVTK